MRKGYWIAAALTLAFVGFGLTAFQKTLTPYLTFDEARKARGVVQVMGGLDKQSDRYDTASQELSASSARVEETMRQLSGSLAGQLKELATRLDTIQGKVSSLK